MAVDMKDAQLLWRIMYQLYYKKLLSYDPKNVVTERGVKLRKAMAPYILKILPLFNPYELHIVRKVPVPKDVPIVYTPTHGYKDDVLNTLLTIQDHAYILFGSLDELFKTFDGLFALIWGSVPVDRDDKLSRLTSVPKMIRPIKFGTNGLVFPEGAWNLTDNELAMKLFGGFYRIAIAAEAFVVPVITHIEGNKCYSIQEKYIDVSCFNEEQARNYLRDVFATYAYELIELASNYSHIPRAELEKEMSLKEQWELHKAYLKSQPKYYIEEKEKNYPYKDKNIITEEKVFEVLNNIEITTKEKAKVLAKIKRKAS